MLSLNTRARNWPYALVAVIQMNDSNVPIAASCDVLLSVAFVETRRSELIDQRPRSARNGPPSHGSGGDVRPTALRSVIVC